MDSSIRQDLFIFFKIEVHYSFHKNSKKSSVLNTLKKDITTNSKSILKS